MKCKDCGQEGFANTREVTDHKAVCPALHAPPKGEPERCIIGLAFVPEILKCLGNTTVALRVVGHYDPEIGFIVDPGGIEYGR